MYFLRIHLCHGFFNWLKKYNSDKRGDMNQDKSIQMQFDSLLEEYRTLKLEIVSNLEASRNISNLTLTAIGALIALTPFIINNDAIFLFLIAPIFFYGLAWSQLRYIYLVLDMGAYLRNTVIPGIHRVLSSSRKNRHIDEIMSWELPGKNPTSLRKNKLLRILFLPIAGANYGIPILASAFSALAFVFLSKLNSQAFSTLHIAMLTINIIALIYSAFWGFQAEFRR